jgi:hypothetical protein
MITSALLGSVSVVDTGNVDEDSGMKVFHVLTT